MTTWLCDSFDSGSSLWSRGTFFSFMSQAIEDIESAEYSIDMAWWGCKVVVFTLGIAFSENTWSLCACLFLLIPYQVQVILSAGFSLSAVVVEVVYGAPRALIHLSHSILAAALALVSRRLVLYIALHSPVWVFGCPPFYAQLHPYPCRFLLVSLSWLPASVSSECFSFLLMYSIYLRIDRGRVLARSYTASYSILWFSSNTVICSRMQISRSSKALVSTNYVHARRYLNIEEIVFSTSEMKVQYKNDMFIFR